MSNPIPLDWRPSRLTDLAATVRKERASRSATARGAASIRQAVGDVDAMQEASRLAEANEMEEEEIFNTLSTARGRRGTGDPTPGGRSTTSSTGYPVSIQPSMEEEQGGEGQEADLGESSPSQGFFGRSLSRMDSLEDLKRPDKYLSRMFHSRGESGDPPALFCGDKALLVAGLMATGACFVFFCFLIVVKVVWMSEVAFGLEESEAA